MSLKVSSMCTSILNLRHFQTKICGHYEEQFLMGELTLEWKRYNSGIWGRKSGQIINDDIYIPFYVFFISCLKGTHNVYNYVTQKK
jgi:hypothetical protein